MSRLTPDLFTRRFDDLVEMGRSRLPGMAPDWTDHNAHDPGITLMELLAWVAEAQMYSLARAPRTDERTAYAALFDLAQAGTQPARGLIWSDRLDPRSPVATFRASIVIPTDAVVHVLNSDTPTFRPAHKVLWAPGRISRLEARLADGRTRDFTAINDRGGPPFLPFGENAGRDDVLTMTFDCRSLDGLFPRNRKDAEGAQWVIGVRADAAAPGTTSDSDEPSSPGMAPLVATMLIDGVRVPLAVVSDSTEGMLRTGALVLDVAKVADSPKKFAIEFRAMRGFPRPPRLMRIEPNVIPILQGQSIVRETDAERPANGIPDQTLELAVPGLKFAAGEDPVRVELLAPSGLVETWEHCERLSERGPDEQVYELDTAAARITFGNGINGRRPPAKTQILVSYNVCDGGEGNIARNRKWQVSGFSGAFGVNPEPVTGGVGSTTAVDQRREARWRAQHDHPIVSSADVEAAARALPLLEVARTWILPQRDGEPRTGRVTLVALRARPNGTEPADIPETPRWLNAIQRRLSGRMPLGATLSVIAPRYVEFYARATLEADPGRDPDTIKAAVANELTRRLALVDIGSNVPRALSDPVTLRDVSAWIRAIDGVNRIAGLQLVLATGKAVDEIKVPRSGLPRFDRAQTTIAFTRSGTGGTS